MVYKYSFENNTFTPVNHGISEATLHEVRLTGEGSNLRGLTGVFVVNDGTRFVNASASTSTLRNAIVDIKTGKYVTTDNTSRVSAYGVLGINDTTNYEYVFYNTDNIFSSEEVPRPENISYSLNPEDVLLRWASSPGAESYEIFRNNQSIGTTSETSFKDIGSVRGKYTRYSVKAMIGGSSSSSRSVSVDWKKSMLLGSKGVAQANTYVKLGGLTFRLISDNTLIYVGKFDSVSWDNPQDGFLVSAHKMRVETLWYSKLTDLEKESVVLGDFTVPNTDQLNSSFESINHYFAPPSADELRSYRKTYGVDLISGYSYLWVRDRGFTDAYYLESGYAPFLKKSDRSMRSVTFVTKLNSDATFTSVGSSSTAGTITNPWVLNGIEKPKPLTPNNFKATDATFDRVTLSWSKVTGAGEYVLKRDDKVVYAGQALTYTDQALLDDTEYTYTLVARNAIGDSLPAQLNVKTLLEPAITPVDFKVVTKTADTVKLSWTKNDSDSYTIKRGEDVVYSNDGNSFEDVGLEPNTDYVYTLIANRGVSKGDPVTVNVTTNQEVLDAVTGLASTRIGYDNIDLKWNPVVKATSYTVYQDGYEIHKGSDLAFSVTGLNEGTEYTYAVEANKGIAVSPSATIKVTTKLEKILLP